MSTIKWFKLSTCVAAIGLAVITAAVQAEMICVVVGEQWQHPQSDACDGTGKLASTTVSFELINFSLDGVEIQWSDAACRPDATACHLLIDVQEQKTLCAVILVDDEIQQKTCATAFYRRW